MNTSVLDSMRSNFLAASEFERRNMKSSHWLLYMEKKGDLFAEPELWKEFRSNVISQGLDNSNFAARRHRSLERNRSRCEFILDQVGPQIPTEFHLWLEEVPVGSALTHTIGGRRMSRSSIEFTLMLSHLVPYLRDARVVVEIGGGYGGLARLIKSVFPSLRYVLLDLPEASAIQTYYLNETMPNSQFIYAKELLEKDSLPIESKFDFMIAPGSLAERLPDDSIDLFINTRSMMEMDLPIVNFYFKQMERTLVPDGGFYSVNRYRKISNLKDYPFDQRWYASIWAPWPTYIDRNPHHEILAFRTGFPVYQGVQDLLKALPEDPGNSLKDRLRRRWQRRRINSRATS